MTIPAGCRSGESAGAIHAGVHLSQSSETLLKAGKTGEGRYSAIGIAAIRLSAGGSCCLRGCLSCCLKCCLSLWRIRVWVERQCESTKRYGSRRCSSTAVVARRVRSASPRSGGDGIGIGGCPTILNDLGQLSSSCCHLVWCEVEMSCSCCRRQIDSEIYWVRRLVLAVAAGIGLSSRKTCCQRQCRPYEGAEMRRERQPVCIVFLSTIAIVRTWNGRQSREG